MPAAGHELPLAAVRLGVSQLITLQSNMGAGLAVGNWLQWWHAKRAGGTVLNAVALCMFHALRFRFEVTATMPFTSVAPHPRRRARAHVRNRLRR